MRRSALMTTNFMMVVAGLFALLFAKQGITGEDGFGWLGIPVALAFILLAFAMQRLALWWYRKLHEMSSDGRDG